MQALTTESFKSRLNEDLALELRAVIQMVNHIGRVSGETSNYPAISMAGLHIRIDRVAELTGRLQDLGSSPTTRVSPPHIGLSRAGALVEDISLERILLVRYQKRLEQAKQLNLEAASEFVAGRINELADHINRLEALADAEMME